MKKIICWLFGHIGGEASVKNAHRNNLKIWIIKCRRCGHVITYNSVWVRLIGIEKRLGFDGNITKLIK